MCEGRAWPPPSATPNAAGFREVAVLHPHIVFRKIDSSVPDEALVAFGCALPTAVAGVERLGGIPVAGNVVVQGSGPVGLAFVLLARLAGARNIILIGAPSARLALGVSLGATAVFDIATTSVAERRAAVLEVTGGRGSEVVIEAAGQLTAFPEGLNLVARSGRYLIAGLYAGDATVDFNPVAVNRGNLSMLGSLVVNAEHMLRAVELVDMYHETFDFKRFVDQRFSLSSTHAAIDSMARGMATKVVIVP
nr:zinc-binding dehydrogenase [Aeromicrobium wangtongii]